MGIYIFFIERKKKHSKNLVQGLNVQKTFQLLSHTPGYNLILCPG